MKGKAAVFVALIVVLSSVALVSTDIEADDGPWAGGSGSQSDPYLISTEQQLQYIGAVASNPNNHYLLINDITVTSSWMPIGSSGGAFNGTLDGNGYTIRGLNLDGDGDVGFIADNNGTVRNLFFDDVTVVLTGYEVIGGIIAATNTGTIENCLVSNSSLTMDYTSEDVVATIYAGGIAGLNRGTISMCEMKDSDVNISHTSRDSISYITDEQRLDVQNNMYVGGIAGYSSGVVENCLSNASVSVYTHSRFTGTAHMVGGFEPTVKSYGGGIVGYSSGRVSDCANVNDTAFSGKMEITGKNFWGTPSAQRFCDSGFSVICGYGTTTGSTSCAMNIGFIPQTVYSAWDHTTNPNEADAAWFINNSVPHLVHPFLRVDKAPDKTNYVAGDNFSSEGLLVSVHNTNGGSELVTPSRISDKFSNDYSSISLIVQSGSRTTHFSYGIEVEPEFTVLSAPSKTTYYPGELFDPTGMKIGYRMSSSESYQEFTGYTVYPNVLALGTNEVTIDCGSWTTTFQVTVVEPPDNVLTVSFMDDVAGNYSEYYLSGQTMTFKAPTSGDRVFLGWNTAQDGSGTSYSPGTTITVTVNSTFYAIWEPEPSSGDDSGGLCDFSLVLAFIAVFVAVFVPMALVRW